MPSSSNSKGVLKYSELTRRTRLALMGGSLQKAKYGILRNPINLAMQVPGFIAALEGRHGPCD